MEIIFEKVGVSACSSYEYSTVKRSLQEALTPWKGLNSFLHSGQKVLVKPNLLAPESPEKAVTTHPSIVKAIIETAVESGAEVFVGDSPMRGTLEEVCKVSGILQVVQETGAHLLPFRTVEEVYYNNANTCSNFPLAKEALEMDFIINAAKFKTHTFTGITAAVKNCFGFIVGADKKRFHLLYPLRKNFSDMLLDLYLLTKPGLSVIDAVIAMEGPGPRSGRPRPMKSLIVSPSAVAADAVVAELAGFASSEISTLESASRHKIPGHRLNQIEIKGPLHSLYMQDFDKGAGGKGWSFLWRYLPAWFRNYNERNRPWPVITAKCSVCGFCQESCPAEVIKEDSETGGYFIQQEKCIRCYCCMEACPRGAIELQ